MKHRELGQEIVGIEENKGLVTSRHKLILGDEDGFLLESKKVQIVRDIDGNHESVSFDGTDPKVSTTGEFGEIDFNVAYDLVSDAVRRRVLLLVDEKYRHSIDLELDTKNEGVSVLKQKLKKAEASTAIETIAVEEDALVREVLAQNTDPDLALGFAELQALNAPGLKRVLAKIVMFLRASNVAKSTNPPRMDPLILSKNTSTRLSNFKSQFDGLFDRDSRGFSWEQVVMALPYSVDELIERTSKLENPRVKWIDDDDNLVISDGGPDVPKKTLGKTYIVTRKDTKSEGLSLFTLQELMRLYHDSIKYLSNSRTWIEYGEKVETLEMKVYEYSHRYKKIVAETDSSGEDVTWDTDHYGVNKLGALRLLRVKLSFK